MTADVPAQDTDPARKTRRTLVGLGLIVVGAVLGMLSMTALPWYRSSFNGILDTGTSAPRIRSSIALYQGQPATLQGLFDLGISPAYFSWLGLTVLLVAAVVGFVSAGLDGLVARIVSVGAGVVAVAGIVLTAIAIYYVRLDGAQFRRAVPTYSDFVTQSSVGAWAIVLGYVAVGVGAVLAADSRQTIRDLLADPEDDPDDIPDNVPDNVPDGVAVAEVPDAPAPEVPVERPVKRENW